MQLWIRIKRTGQDVNAGRQAGPIGAPNAQIIRLQRGRYRKREVVCAASLSPLSLWVNRTAPQRCEGRLWFGFSGWSLSSYSQPRLYHTRRPPSPLDRAPQPGRVH